jgi:hypothetical protein
MIERGSNAVRRLLAVVPGIALSWFAGVSAADAAAPAKTPDASAATTLSSRQWIAVIAIVVVGMLAAGLIVILARHKLSRGKGADSGSVIRSWIAVSLVMGLITFCGAAFAIDDQSLRSALFGGLIANVGAAVAFYFSSKNADQARADILQASAALGRTAAPTAFSNATPQNGKVGEEYHFKFIANGQPPPEYSLANGDVPHGLKLEPDGTLSGKPDTADTKSFTVVARNPSGTYSTDASITIDPADPA